MHNQSIHELDATPRAVVAIATQYPFGHRLPCHTHRRAQLLYGAEGVMQVHTEHGSWVVPPQQAVWIPARVTHEVVFLGVSTRSLYIEPDGVTPGRQGCEVIHISALTRQLLLEAVDLPLLYDEGGRDGLLMRLLLKEVDGAASLPSYLPLPAHERLLACCQAFLQAPDIHAPPQGWAQTLCLSERSFSRLFREQTGMSFGQWRQRACGVLALARLAEGGSVTAIALGFGYESTAAFSTMFRRVLGCAPTAFLAR